LTGRERILWSTNLKKENNIFSAVDRITNESGPCALDEKKGISDTTKGF